MPHVRHVRVCQSFFYWNEQWVRRRNSSAVTNRAAPVLAKITIRSVLMPSVDADIADAWPSSRLRVLNFERAGVAVHAFNVQLKGANTWHHVTSIIPL